MKISSFDLRRLVFITNSGDKNRGLWEIFETKSEKICCCCFARMRFICDVAGTIAGGHYLILRTFFHNPD